MQEDRGPELAQAADLVPHPGTGLGVEAGRRLVEEQHAWAMDDAEADVQPATHAARVAHRGPVGGGLEIEGREDLGRAGLGGRLIHAVQPTLDHQLAAAGLGRVRGTALRHVADPAADLLRILGEVGAGDGRRPAGGLEERREHAQGRRLAGAVGAEEAEDLAGPDLEVHAAHGLDILPLAADLERPPQLVGLDHQGHRARSCGVYAGVVTCAVQHYRSISALRR